MARQELQSPPAEAPHIEMLVARADLEAERTIAWTRIVVAAGLLLMLYLTTRRFEMGDIVNLATRRSAARGMTMFLLSGVFVLLIIRFGLFRSWMSYLFVAVDSAVIGISLASTMHASELTANFFVVTPAIFIIPIMMAVGTLRYRPNVQLFFLATLVPALAIAAYAEDFAVWPTGGPAEGINNYLSLPVYVMRVAMLLMAGLVSVLVLVRARRLLLAAVTEALNRATLTRFLPSEVVPLVASGRFAELRRGRRQHAVIMFVDIRGSTALAENMDPHRLSIFIAAFRRRVVAAAQAHGGVIDKFIGDGAMIVFGLPEPSPDDAARALACAHDLLARIARWNMKRAFDPPLAVGIGVHVGEVYFGVVGDRDRMELTVIGDTVNVAARLEQATKDYKVPLIASEAVIREACANTSWREVGREPLRGRSEDIALYAPLPRPALIEAQAEPEPAPPGLLPSPSTV
jgi:adenylate cyclase